MGIGRSGVSGAPRILNGAVRAVFRIASICRAWSAGDVGVCAAAIPVPMRKTGKSHLGFLCLTVRLVGIKKWASFHKERGRRMTMTLAFFFMLDRSLALRLKTLDCGLSLAG